MNVEISLYNSTFAIFVICVLSRALLQLYLP